MDNVKLFELNFLIQHIIPQISTRINRNLTNGIKNETKCNLIRCFVLFLHNSIQFQAEKVNNFSGERSKLVDERS